MYYDIFDSEEFSELQTAVISAIMGGEVMSKTKYEQKIRELEEKEGKCFTIKEVSEITRIPVDMVKLYLSLNSAKIFKIRHYKTQKNMTLISQSEILKLMLNRTSILPLLKGLAALKVEKCNSIDDWINLLTSIQLEG